MVRLNTGNRHHVNGQSTGNRSPAPSLATELSESGSRLSALADPDSAVDARASLSLSYQVLSPGAARLLRLSALHPGSEVSREAMASLAGISTPEAAAGLEELERGHLMTRPGPGPGYYASHDLVRAYAAELADADPATELHPARMRVLGHYRQSALPRSVDVTPTSKEDTARRRAGVTSTGSELGRGVAPDPVLPLAASGQPGSQLVVQRRVVLAGFFGDGLRDQPRAACFRRGGRPRGDQRGLVLESSPERARLAQSSAQFLISAA